MIAVLSFSALSQAQDDTSLPASHHSPSSSIPPPARPVELDSPGSSMEPGRLRSLNIDRQKSLVSDTNKILSLANELNAEIAQNRTDSLTPAQLRKMNEIEKLARNVKFKMSTSFVDPVELHPPIFPRQ